MIKNSTNETMVSVALATYNGEKYLCEQLDSILNQSYNNIEIVVVDDCSTDGTMDILERYFSKVNMKLYRNKKNVGFVKTFEKALGMCSGRYIALCDQDDIWEKDKVEQLVNEIKGYSLAYSDVSLIDSDGITFVISRKNYFGISNRSNLSFKDLIFKNYVIGCASLFERDLLKDALPFPIDAMFHDWWISTVASKKKGIKYFDKPLVKYRQHSGNTYGIKKNGILKKILLLLFRSNKKCEDYRARYRRLKSMMNHSLIQKDEQDFIKGAMEYYKSYFDSKRLIRHLALTIRYYKYITTKQSIYYLIKR